jgi:hypothetical protein
MAAVEQLVRIVEAEEQVLARITEAVRCNDANAVLTAAKELSALRSGEALTRY